MKLRQKKMMRTQKFYNYFRKTIKKLGLCLKYAY